MRLTVTFAHTEQEIPPRCRKPRPVPYNDGEHTVEIPEVTGQEAPIALIEYASNPYQEHAPKLTITYRWYREALYADIRTGNKHRNDQVVELPTPEDLKWRVATHRSLAENIETLDKRTSYYLIIDGQSYYKTPEPVYHRDGQRHYGSVDYQINENWLDSYWPVTQRAEVEAAVQAECGGEFDCGSAFEVLMPEVIRFTRPLPMRDPVTGITNGRWTLDGFGEDKVVAHFDDRPDEEIAEVKYSHRGADARILAASADLYNAARKVANSAYWSAGKPNQFVMAKLQAAVRKAEGINESEELDLCIPYPATS